MLRFLRICLVCLALPVPLGVTTAFAQTEQAPKGKWDGNIVLEGASNFHLTPESKRSHNLGVVGATVDYSLGGLSLNLSSKLELEHRITGAAGGNIRVADGDTTKKADASVNEKSYISSVSGINLGWYKNPEDRFKAYYNYSFDKSTPDNYNLTTTAVEGSITEFDYTVQTGDHRNGTHKGGASYEHDFITIGAMLSASLDVAFHNNSKYSEWTSGQGKGELDTDPSRYRTTPTSDYSNYVLQVTYSDKRFFDLNNLDVDFSLTYHFKDLSDHQSAANYINEQWQDSTSAREDFNYRTATLTPKARVRYTIGIYKVDLTYSPQYFAYKLSGNSQEGDINKGKISHLVNLTNTFNPWPEHSFILKFAREEDRPDYLQICWFPRSSNTYSNELYVGNTDLQSCITTTGNLIYEYKRKRFNANLNLSCVFQPRKIEQTYNTEEIDGKEYRVYTWVNGGRSTEGNADLSLGWKEGNFDAVVNGHFNIYKGYSMSGSETKSNSYSFSGRAAYTLKTWTFQADAKYSSGVTRTYYSITSLVDANFLITKTFGEHFKVFLEGKDLLDRPVTVKTTSEDETEIRYERHNDYKRLVRIGINYKF